MLEHLPDLTLSFLNEATQAWVEYEYNRKVHSEIGEAPLTRFLAGPEVTRPSPDSDTLRLAFTRTDHRMQRKSDGTVVIEGRRFEAPNRYRHLSRVEVRYAGWDLGLVHLVDARTGKVLSRLYPQDRTQNASGLRRRLDPISPEPMNVKPATGIAPLLARLIDRQAATGLPLRPESFLAASRSSMTCMSLCLTRLHQLAGRDEVFEIAQGRVQRSALQEVSDQAAWRGIGAVIFGCGWAGRFKFNDTQLVLLSAASQRDDHCLVPPAGPRRGQVQKAAAKLLEAGLLKEIKAKAGAPIWRRDDETGLTYALKLTAAGAKAIAADETRSLSEK